jgi:dipeptidyl aminopeptidase/acylaminoacyl peptidase
MRTLTLVSLVSLSFATPAAAATPKAHPFTIADMLAMDRVGDPQVSPDGSSVVFSLSRTDFEANRRRSDLWLVGVEGNGMRRLTAHADGSDSGARWAADSKSLFFLSNRSGSSQVWRIALDGGEATQVTSLPLDVNTFVPSADGKLLVLSLDVFVDCANLDCTKKRLDEVAAKKASGRVYDKLFFRHWDTWSDGRRSHLFVVPVAGGEAVDLMKTMDADSPSKPFGGTEEFAISPDGKSVVFSAKDVGREEAWSTNFDLFAAPLDGSAAPRAITAANRAWDTPTCGCPAPTAAGSGGSPRTRPATRTRVGRPTVSPSGSSRAARVPRRSGASR